MLWDETDLPDRPLDVCLEGTTDVSIDSFRCDKPRTWRRPSYSHATSTRPPNGIFASYSVTVAGAHFGT